MTVKVQSRLFVDALKCFHRRKPALGYFACQEQHQHSNNRISCVRYFAATTASSEKDDNDNGTKKNLYRLIYFDVRGAVEPTRYLLALANAPYEDFRYPMKATASGFGTDQSFQRDKDTGKFARNMDRLPILQILDEKGGAASVTAEIGQSHTINRFIAERHGLFGKDLLERALIDATYESVRDIRSRYLSVKQKKLTERTEWMTKKLPRFCKRLEASLPPPNTNLISNDQPWLVGNEASLADVALYAMLGSQISIISGSTINFFDGVAVDMIDKAYADCPRLIQSIKATAALPAIQKWEQKRPDTFN